MVTYTWRNGTTGSWSLPLDWTFDIGTTIPKILDTAIIDAGTVSLDIAGSVAALVQDGTAGASVLAGPYGLNVAGSASFTGTTVQTGAGETKLHGASALGTVATAGTLWLDGGHVLTNFGTFTVSNGQIVIGAAPDTVTGGATFFNASTGTFDVAGPGTVIALGSGGGSLYNTGVVLKSDASLSSIAAPVVNTGTIHVAAGTLAFSGGLSTTGAGLVIDSGATLAVGSAGLAVSSRILSTRGAITATGGTIDMTTAILRDSLGAIALNDNAALVLGTHAALIGTLQMSATTGGSNTISSSRAVGLTDTQISGIALFSGPGATTLQQSATLAAAADASPTALYIDAGRKLVNRGNMHLGSGTIYLGATPTGTATGGGMLVNMTHATLDFADDTGVAGGTGAIAMVNSGTLSKLTGTGTATIGVFLRDSGPLHIGSGTLQFTAGAKLLSRNLTVDAGATLAVAGGAFSVISGTLALGGMIVLSAGTFDLTRPSSISAGGMQITGGIAAFGVRNATLGQFTQTGGLVTGTGVITVTGAALFSGTSTESGTGVTVLRGTTTLDAGASLYLDGRRMLQNDGTLVDHGGQVLLGALPAGVAFGDGILANNGRFDIQADGTAVVAGAGYSSLSNGGLLIKSAGTGTAAIAAGVVNLGTIEAASGTLQLANASGNGLYAVDDHCVLDFTGAVTAGSVSFLGNAGTLELDAPAAFTATIADFGAGSAIDLAGFATIPSFAFASSSAGNILTVTGASQTIQLAFATDLSAHSFLAVSDGHGGVLVS